MIESKGTDEGNDLNQSVVQYVEAEATDPISRLIMSDSAKHYIKSY